MGSGAMREPRRFLATAEDRTVSPPFRVGVVVVVMVMSPLRLTVSALHKFVSGRAAMLIVVCTVVLLVAAVLWVAAAPAGSAATTDRTAAVSPNMIKAMPLRRRRCCFPSFMT